MTAMQYTSTRDATLGSGFGAALQQGLAPDGGLYVPASWPTAPLDLQSASLELAPLAAQVLAPFLAGDALADALTAMVGEAFNFSAPLVALEPQAKLSLLELFHGPTAAFKDFGARFLAAALARVPR